MFESTGLTDDCLRLYERYARQYLCVIMYMLVSSFLSFVHGNPERVLKSNTPSPLIEPLARSLGVESQVEMPDHFRHDQAEFGVRQVLADAVPDAQSKRLESAFIVVGEFWPCGGEPAFGEEVVGAVEICRTAVGGDDIVAYHGLLRKSVEKEAGQEGAYFFWEVVATDYCAAFWY